MVRGTFKYCPNCGAGLKAGTIEKKKRLVCPGCCWVNYENPLPSAAAFVRNRNGEILLVKRGVEPARGKWALPSGFIEIDETPEKACLRELKEETGLEGEIVRLLGVYSQESMLYKNVLIIGYEVDARGKLSPGSDSQKVEFFSVRNLPAIPFSSHRKMIKDEVTIERK
ncbi:MAG: NUDIX hydrolase [Candidatus Aminicenantes bacterium]|nr:MAG: NUDIX hydrolase [Candidatus Aminicenantes bacterium]